MYSICLYRFFLLAIIFIYQKIFEWQEWKKSLSALTRGILSTIYERHTTALTEYPIDSIQKLYLIDINLFAEIGWMQCCDARIMKVLTNMLLLRHYDANSTINSILSIYVRKVSYHTESMLLCNFVIGYFPYFFSLRDWHADF